MIALRDREKKPESNQRRSILKIRKEITPKWGASNNSRWYDHKPTCSSITPLKAQPPSKSKLSFIKNKSFAWCGSMRDRPGEAWAEQLRWECELEAAQNMVAVDPSSRSHSKLSWRSTLRHLSEAAWALLHCFCLPVHRNWRLLMTIFNIRAYMHIISQCLVSSQPCCNGWSRCLSKCSQNDDQAVSGQLGRRNHSCSL